MTSILPGSLVEVEPRLCDGFSGVWLALGMSRDKQDVRVARSREPLDALVLPVDALIPRIRCEVVQAADPVLALLVCWVDFATWWPHV